VFEGLQEEAQVIRQRVFHPLLFAAYPVLALLAYNIDWLRPQQALRALLLSVALALLLLVVLARLLRSWHRAGLLVSLLVILFFAYGHLYESIKVGIGSDVGRHRYLAPLYLATAGFLTWWIVRRLRRPEAATGILNVVALAALAFPLVTLLRSGVASLSAPPIASEDETRLELPAGQRPPDVYFIVVDGYARQDTLRDVYDLDNSEFLDFLEQRGFYVARDSRSNYAQTGLSLASTLNLDYIEAIVPGAHEGTTGRDVLWRLIKNSQVRRQLEALGYVTVAFSSGLAGTELTDADYYLTAGAVDEDLGLVGSTPFESLMIETSALRLISDGVVALPRLFPDVRYPYEVHRGRIRNILNNLGDLPPTEEPKFVFAHIIAPHPPFVFAADGSPVTPDAPFTLRFTFDASDPSSQDYIAGYRDQVKFVNGELEKVITAILENSEVPPVIILEGDHGPDSNSGQISYVQERMANLNAILLPPADARLYPGLTPVNSFRLVFDEVFGGDYPLLEDRVLYSQYDTPYNFRDVTDDIRSP
jgi:hypothetical protein